ncbi:MAG TPA: DUF2207 domain-containing protein [Chiayiivirga sp.]|nr:DUF2207 domain-containing protein [Chiayiivirga sp.]
MTRLFAALFICLCYLLPAHAQERILAYDSSIAVQADGSMDVEERIRVRAEGHQIRRGIYRDFPTRYKDRYGNRVVVDFQVKDVLRDAKPEPWFTENIANGVRLNTGNDDFLPTPAEFTFTLRYRTTRQLGFFKDHDELYWNAIGTGWVFPIESASVDVTLPQPVPVADLKAEGYTGIQGSKAQDLAASIPAPGQAHWQLTEALMPYEGMTIVLSFPKGLIAEPSALTRAFWLLKDNRGVLIALLGFVVFITYMVRRWREVGRDPAAGVVIARYEPPSDYSPAALRFIRRMGADTRCVTADLLSLAVNGNVQIERDKGFLKDSWILRRVAGHRDGLSASQIQLLDGFFKEGDELKLDNKNHSLLQMAIKDQTQELETAYADRMFKRHGGSVGKAFLIGAASMAAAAFLSGGHGLLALIVLGILMVFALLIFSFLVRAPTPEGRTLLDEIAGLKLYLSVAERDDLARLSGPDAPPQLDAERYQKLLPYAVALEVEDAWTDKFTLAVGVAAAAATTAAISWYHGGSFSSLSNLTNAVSSSLNSQIASASTPPGSSSGGGGGGFSGGGGGGGGGGGR